jgi:hypothetical protein
MSTHHAWVCLACSKTGARAAFRTLEAVANAARKHGCLQFVAPTRRADKARLTRVQMPALLTQEKWRMTWDSLDYIPRPTVPCRSEKGACGHAESVHFFSSVTSPYCEDNCGGCRPC